MAWTHVLLAYVVVQLCQAQWFPSTQRPAQLTFSDTRRGQQQLLGTDTRNDWQQPQRSARQQSSSTVPRAAARRLVPGVSSPRWLTRFRGADEGQSQAQMRPWSSQASGVVMRAGGSQFSTATTLSPSGTRPRGTVIPESRMPRSRPVYRHAFNPRTFGTRQTDSNVNQFSTRAQQQVHAQRPIHQVDPRGRTSTRNTRTRAENGFGDNLPTRSQGIRRNGTFDISFSHLNSSPGRSRSRINTSHATERPSRITSVSRSRERGENIDSSFRSQLSEPLPQRTGARFDPAVFDRMAMGVTESASDIVHSARRSGDSSQWSSRRSDASAAQPNRDVGSRDTTVYFSFLDRSQPSPRSAIDRVDAIDTSNASPARRTMSRREPIGGRAPTQEYQPDTTDARTTNTGQFDVNNILEDSTAALNPFAFGEEQSYRGSVHNIGTVESAPSSFSGNTETTRLRQQREREAALRYPSDSSSFNTFSTDRGAAMQSFNRGTLVDRQEGIVNTVRTRESQPIQRQLNLIHETISSRRRNREIPERRAIHELAPVRTPISSDTIRYEIPSQSNSLLGRREPYPSRLETSLQQWVNSDRMEIAPAQSMPVSIPEVQISNIRPRRPPIIRGAESDTPARDFDTSLFNRAQTSEPLSDDQFFNRNERSRASFLPVAEINVPERNIQVERTTAFPTFDMSFIDFRRSTPRPPMQQSQVTRYVTASPSSINPVSDTNRQPTNTQNIAFPGGLVASVRQSTSDTRAPEDELVPPRASRFDSMGGHRTSIQTNRRAVATSNAGASDNGVSPIPSNAAQANNNLFPDSRRIGNILYPISNTESDPSLRQIFSFSITDTEPFMTHRNDVDQHLHSTAVNSPVEAEPFNYTSLWDTPASSPTVAQSPPFNANIQNGRPASDSDRTTVRGADTFQNSDQLFAFLQDGMDVGQSRIIHRNTLNSNTIMDERNEAMNSQSVVDNTGIDTVNAIPSADTFQNSDQLFAFLQDSMDVGQSRIIHRNTLNSNTIMDQRNEAMNSQSAVDNTGIDTVNEIPRIMTTTHLPTTTRPPTTRTTTTSMSTTTTTPRTTTSQPAKETAISNLTNHLDQVRALLHRMGLKAVPLTTIDTGVRNKPTPISQPVAVNFQQPMLQNPDSDISRSAFDAMAFDRLAMPQFASFGNRMALSQIFPSQNGQSIHLTSNENRVVNAASPNFHAVTNSENVLLGAPRTRENSSGFRMFNQHQSIKPMVPVGPHVRWLSQPLGSLVNQRNIGTQPVSMAIHDQSPHIRESLETLVTQSPVSKPSPVNKAGSDSTVARTTRPSVIGQQLNEFYQLPRSVSMFNRMPDHASAHDKAMSALIATAPSDKRGVVKQQLSDFAGPVYSVQNATNHLKHIPAIHIQSKSIQTQTQAKVHSGNALKPPVDTRQNHLKEIKSNANGQSNNPSDFPESQLISIARSVPKSSQIIQKLTPNKIPAMPGNLLGIPAIGRGQQTANMKIVIGDRFGSKQATTTRPREIQNNDNAISALGNGDNNDSKPKTGSRMSILRAELKRIMDMLNTSENA